MPEGLDLSALLRTALQAENAASEALDAAVHIAMIAAVQEISARWPRRRLHLTAGMGSCTIDVTGASKGRPICWRFYWGTEGCWETNDVHYADDRPHQVFVGRKLVVESELIDEISQINDELHRDPIDYAPSFVCVGGEVIQETEDKSDGG